MQISAFFKCLGASIKEADSLGLAAEMAYHLLLSLFPSLIFVIGLLRYVGATFDLFDEVIPMLYHTLPKDVIPVVRDTIRQVLHSPGDTFAILGFLGFLWTASNGASALIKGISRAYQFDYAGTSTVKDKLMSIAIILGIATGLVIALNLLLFGNNVIAWAGDRLQLSGWVTIALHTFRLVVGLGGILLSSVFIYTITLKQLTPHIRWTQTLPGAFTFVGLWLATSLGFTWYVEHYGNFNKVYGALGGVIILMTWLYLSSFAALVGAHINAIIRSKAFSHPTGVCPPQSNKLALSP
jgi:membrane protein